MKELTDEQREWALNPQRLREQVGLSLRARKNALNAECMNYFHQVNIVINQSSPLFHMFYQWSVIIMVFLQDISPSFYHVQKPKAFLRPIITNLGNECIDPNISAENRQRSVQWITTELRKQTAR